MWHTSSSANPNHLEQKLGLLKGACKTKFKNTEAGDLTRAEAELKKVQEELHLHPGDKHLVDIECSKTETYRRLKKEWEARLRQKAKLKWFG